MQKSIKINPFLPLGLKFGVIVGLIFFFVQMPDEAKAAALHSKNETIFPYRDDNSVSTAIQTAKNTGSLLFPLTVERFYAKNGDKLVWIVPEKIKPHSLDAMLLLDCVVQYGLVSADYHPKELTYNQLHRLIDHPDKVTDSKKASYDILLTDAMIAMINNLHFGKLNVNYTPDKLDAGNFEGCHADLELTNALNQKDFMSAIESVQPKDHEYDNLQYQIYLLTGLYICDNYELSETDIKKMAINMERLRWAANDDITYVSVNIPSFTLEFHRPDVVQEFRILSGKPATPTPMLVSAIGSIQLSKGWNAASKRIYFTFYNRDGIYLGNTPDQLSFKKEDRAVTNGTLNIEHAQKLAGLLLANDGNLKSVPLITKALKKNRDRVFILRTKIPFKVTYITCAVDKGILVIYNDVYQLDEDLEMKLYNVTNTLALDLKAKSK